MGKLIGIGGVSRAGKTSLANFLASHLSNAIVLHQDDFVLDEHLIPKVRGRVDWEVPESTDWERWNKALEDAQSTYEHVILDGIFVFHDKAVEDTMHTKIYLGIDKDRFLELRRKEHRWGDEPEWFIQHVWDSHFKFGLPHSKDRLIEFHDISTSDYSSVLAQVQS